MEPEPLVHDTTVLINLACIRDPAIRSKIVDALKSISVIAMEVDEELRAGLMSARQYPNAALARQISQQLPQGPEDDFDLIERGDDLQQRISRPYDPPNKHLGESGSAALAESCEGTLVTDDNAGPELARITRVPLLTTAALLQTLVQGGSISCEESQSAYSDIIAADRWVDPDANVC